MSHISLKMCARRAVRVTSVFSSAAASLRVRTDRDVCRAENCVRNTSGNRSRALRIKIWYNFTFVSGVLTIKNQESLSRHTSKLVRSPDFMLPSSRMTPPQRVYMERLLASLSLSPSLFSSSCFSLIFSQFLRRNTRCFSTKFLMNDGQEDRSVKIACASVCHH